MWFKHWPDLHVDLTRYLDASIKKRLRTVICSYFQFLSSRDGREDFGSFAEKGDHELHEECFKKGYVYIMECNEHDMANVRLIEGTVSHQWIDFLDQIQRGLQIQYVGSNIIIYSDSQRLPFKSWIQNRKFRRAIRTHSYNAPLPLQGRDLAT